MAALPPLEGADPAPRWTLKRLVLSVRERFGCLCCRETIRAALHGLKLSWKKAKKLLGRADPERRGALVGQLPGGLARGQRDQHGLFYLDEAPPPPGAGLRRWGGGRGARLRVAPTPPGLSARV